MIDQVDWRQPRYPLLVKCLFILLALVVPASCTNPDSVERRTGPVGTSPHSSASASPYSEPTGPSLPTILPTTANALRPTGAQRARVAKNVDGDTIWAEPLETGSLPMGAAHKIHILEIDTPETYGSSVECYGPEASAFAKQEIPVGSTVFLLPDKDDKDRYGSFLRYVWKENGEFYNDKAVRLGYAKAVLYMPNDLHIDQMRVRLRVRASLTSEPFVDA